MFLASLSKPESQDVLIETLRGISSLAPSIWSMPQIAPFISPFQAPAIRISLSKKIPNDCTKSQGKSLKSTHTPWKINMEPTNHPCRKENDLNQTSRELLFQPLIFRGVHVFCLIPPTKNVYFNCKCPTESSEIPVKNGQNLNPSTRHAMVHGEPIPSCLTEQRFEARWERLSDLSQTVEVTTKKANAPILIVGIYHLWTYIIVGIYVCTTIIYIYIYIYIFVYIHKSRCFVTVTIIILIIIILVIVIIIIIVIVIIYQNYQYCYRH